MSYQIKNQRLDLIGGVLVPATPEAFAGCEGVSFWTDSLEKFTGKRSSEHNAYYMGVILPAFVQQVNEQTGNNFLKDDFHEEYIKLHCNFKYEEVRSLKNGKLYQKKMRMNTRNLPKKKFAEFVDRVKLWAWDNFKIQVESLPEER